MHKESHTPKKAQRILDPVTATPSEAASSFCEAVPLISLGLATWDLGCDLGKESAGQKVSGSRALSALMKGSGLEGLKAFRMWVLALWDQDYGSESKSLLRLCIGW